MAVAGDLEREAAQGLELTAAEMGFLALVWSDYLAVRADKPESRAKAALCFLPRMLLNPSLQFALLLRIAQKGPRLLHYPIRWVQVVLFSSEIYWFNRQAGIEIGPGIVFPHPFNIIIGPGTRIGANVLIYNSTNIGADRHWGRDVHPADRAVWIGDRAIVYGYVTAQGPFVVGQDAVVGVRVFLDEDVPPGALKTRRTLRLAGEWPGEERPYLRRRSGA
jgi:serine acetyltransferase